jgi:hypothetical protein
VNESPFDGKDALSRRITLSIPFGSTGGAESSQKTLRELLTQGRFMRFLAIDRRFHLSGKRCTPDAHEPHDL